MRGKIGTVLIFACATAGCAQSPPRDRRLAAAPLATRLAAADPQAGAGIFRQCAPCHSILGGSGDRAGPNLYATPGRPIAHGSAQFAYTAALRSVGGVWTFDRLDAWLTNPQHFAPGTSMGFPGLPDGMDRADVILFLNANGSNLPLPPRPAEARQRSD